MKHFQCSVGESFHLTCPLVPHCLRILGNNLIFELSPKHLTVLSSMQLTLVFWTGVIDRTLFISCVDVSEDMPLATGRAANLRKDCVYAAEDANGRK